MEKITRGSRNVFADLGYADALAAPPSGAKRREGPARQTANERQTKLRLAYALNQIIDERRLTRAAPPRAKRKGPARQNQRAAAAAKLGINQPKVSALQNYKLDGFSVERLMTFLNALDRDVEIVIKKKPRSRAAARISVVAA